MLDSRGWEVPVCRDTQVDILSRWGVSSVAVCKMTMRMWLSLGDCGEAPTPSRARNVKHPLPAMSEAVR